MNKRNFNIFALLLILSLVFVETTYAERRVRILGRKEATLTTKFIRLGDIAEVSGKAINDDDIVIGLKKINLGDSPAPGDYITLTANSILEKLKEQGVMLDEVGYTLPRVIKITRASRTISPEEVKIAIDKYIADTDEDLEIEKIHYKDAVKIVPGNSSLKVVRGEVDNSGMMNFSVAAQVDQEEPVRFLVKADINQWREMPVAKRPLVKGAVIGSDDVVMARLNTNAIPGDAAVQIKDIVGLETDQAIAYGEVFRRNKLAIPPVIKRGSKVTIEYKSKFLEASAIGVAEDSGIEGDEIRVKNKASEKVVYGIVIAPGIVRVNQ
ncbi:MAG: flagellar basal body P-ring formation protein FlgA [Bdellovibrionales bacterium]|nr:flagellar basal body P-ring formation protein FlgA [Bdellovibrionales bacterium]